MRFNCSNGLEILSVMILYVTVAEPFFWDVVFEKGTHVGNVLGAILIWLEGRLSGEESECLKA